MDKFKFQWAATYAAMATLGVHGGYIFNDIALQHCHPIGCVSNIGQVCCTTMLSAHAAMTIDNAQRLSGCLIPYLSAQASTKAQLAHQLPCRRKNKIFPVLAIDCSGILVKNQ
jgi:hypothetical protein